MEEQRVNIRISGENLALIKEAAALRGIPYQIYIRTVLYDAAFRDLNEHLRFQEQAASLTSP